MSRANPRVVASARKMARQSSNCAAPASKPNRAVKRQQLQALKRSIVDAATAGAISPERASGMIERFQLREL